MEDEKGVEEELPVYIKGNIYTSDKDGSIFDEEQDSHWFINDDEYNDLELVNEYFKKVE